MLKSRQRLGDDPRDYDGEFEGIDEEHADVCGQRPDVDVVSNKPPAQEPFKPWKIYPKPPPPFWHWKSKEVLSHDDENSGDGFCFEDCEVPGPHPWNFMIDDKGVFQVYGTSDDVQKGESPMDFHVLENIDSKTVNLKPAFDIPDIREYFMDLDFILGVISDGPTKTFAFRRLKYLQSKFTMYSLLNENQELADMKVS